MNHILNDKESDQILYFRLKVALKICVPLSIELAESYLSNKRIYDLASVALNSKVVPIWFPKLCELIYKFCLSSCISFSNYVAKEVFPEISRKFFALVASSPLYPHRCLLELLLCFAEVLFR
jgi:hypothetical protein